MLNLPATPGPAELTAAKNTVLVTQKNAEKTEWVVMALAAIAIGMHAFALTMPHQAPSWIPVTAIALLTIACGMNGAAMLAYQLMQTRFECITAMILAKLRQSPDVTGSAVYQQLLTGLSLLKISLVCIIVSVLLLIVPSVVSLSRPYTWGWTILCVVLVLASYVWQRRLVNALAQNRLALRQIR